MKPFHDLAGFFSAQIHNAEGEGTKVFEPVIGVVTDNKDPQKLSRVKVKYPVLGEQDTSFWAPIVMMGAGKNRGWFFIPEKDDEVLVMFEHGDMQKPVVVGSLWNGKDKPADKNPGGVPRRTIKSRAGSKITFDDEQGQMAFEDGAQKAKIVMDAKNNKVIIQSLDGDVCFQAPKGQVRIVAKAIEITATQNVEIHAGSDMKWGSGGGTTIKSSSVTLSGSKDNANCGVAQKPPAPSATPAEVKDPYNA